MRQRYSYHALHIQDGCALVDVLLGCNAACWKLVGKYLLKLLDVILNISIHGCDLQKLYGVDLTQPFNVNRSPLLVNSMVALGIVFKNFILFRKLKFLYILLN